MSAGWQKLNLSPVREAMRGASGYAGVWRSCRLSHETSRHLLLFRCLKRTKAGTEAAGFGMCRKNAETNAEIRPNKASPYNPPE